MPDFDLADVAKLEVENLVADVTDKEVDDAVEKLAEKCAPIRRAAKAKPPRRATRS